MLQDCPLEAWRAGRVARAWDLVRRRETGDALNWHCLLAWELSDAGRDEEARAVLREALQREPEPCWRELLVELVALIARFDAGGAVQLLRLTGATGDDTALVEDVAHDLMVKRETARAAEVLEAIDPGEGRAWAWSRVACRLVDEGRANGGLALASQVDDARALAALLSACLAKSPSLANHPQFVKALSHLDDPDVADGVLSSLAIILVGQGNLEGARTACSRVTRPADRARALGMVAASAVPLGLLEEAESLLDEVHALLPDVREPAERARVLSALCRVAGGKGEVDEARSRFVEARDLLAGLPWGPGLEATAVLAEDAFVAGLEDEVRILLAAARAADVSDDRAVCAWEDIGELQARLGFVAPASAARPSCDPVRGRFKRGGAAAGMPALERLAAQGRAMGRGGVELLCDLARVALEFGQPECAESLVAEARSLLDCAGCIRADGVADADLEADDESGLLARPGHLCVAVAEADLGRIDEACRVLRCHSLSRSVRVLGLRQVAGRVLGRGDASRARSILAEALRGSRG